MAERDKGEFKNIEDMRLRTGATKSIIELLKDNGCLDEMNESSQVSLLEM